MLPPILTGLRLPIIASPMFLVSNTDLVIASCKAGIVGSVPALNGRTVDDFSAMLDTIDTALVAARETQSFVAPYAVNVILRLTNAERLATDLDLIEQHRVPIVITSVGKPTQVVARVHAYGGIVLHDVTTLNHARKAIEAGVDGLILVCAGAGGHAGTTSPFALLPQVREMFDGVIVLAGAISDGRSVRAAQVLGADLAYMGTRFLATAESAAYPDYKQMVLDSATHELVYTPAFSGVPASYLLASVVRAGYDPDALPGTNGVPKLDPAAMAKPWRDVWSAGQGIGMIHDLPDVATLVARIEAEYRAACVA